jgi:hypothetical protein
VLVPKEKHYRARIIKFIHGVEIGYVIDVHAVEYGKTFDSISHACKGLRLRGMMRNVEGELHCLKRVVSKLGSEDE